MPDKITDLINSPVTRRVACMLVRRVMLAAGPAATGYAMSATGQASGTAACMEMAGWIVTLAQCGYDLWRAAWLAKQAVPK
jgi:cell division GTPase FtsZ